MFERLKQLPKVHKQIQGVVLLKCIKFVFWYAKVTTGNVNLFKNRPKEKTNRHQEGFNRSGKVENTWLTTLIFTIISFPSPQGLLKGTLRRLPGMRQEIYPMPRKSCKPQRRSSLRDPAETQMETQELVLKSHKISAS